MTNAIQYPNSSDLCLGCIGCGQLATVQDGCPDGPAPSNCYDNMVVDAVVAGFGSAFDSSRIIIAICDDCLANAIRFADAHVVESVEFPIDRDEVLKSYDARFAARLAAGDHDALRVQREHEANK